jgi:hypothetical protein
MAVLAVQKPGLSGASVNYSAADAAGDSFPNDEHTTLRVKNASAAAITVTLDATRRCSFGFDHDAAVNVPAGATVEIGPFPRVRFGQTVSAQYTAAASVSVAAVSAQ